MTAGVPPWSLTAGEFELLVREAVDGLPERFRRAMDGTLVVEVADEFDPEEFPGVMARDADGQARRVRREDVYPQGTLQIYGIYTGHTMRERARVYRLLFGFTPALPPSAVVIFRGPCLRANPDLDALRFQVRNLVEHEVGHHFGLTEAEVAAAHNRKRSQERRTGLTGD